MFCDLVGSTELSTRLDPEDLRVVMRRYQDAVAAAVTRYGGHIAKYLGDGVLVYFGWPHYDTQSATTDQATVRQTTAERRQLTVMFCDLVGSTAENNHKPVSERSKPLRPSEPLIGNVAQKILQQVDPDS